MGAGVIFCSNLCAKKAVTNRGDIDIENIKEKKIIDEKNISKKPIQKSDSTGSRERLNKEEIIKYNQEINNIIENNKNKRNDNEQQKIPNIDKEKEILELNENIDIKDKAKEISKEKSNKIISKLNIINGGQIFIKPEKEKSQKENEELNNLKKDNLKLENEIKDMKNKLNIFNNQAKNLENEKKQITQQKIEISQKENNIKNKEHNLNIKNNQLIEKENKLKKKEKELIQRETKIKEEESKNKVVLIGLNNIGATCYMNATLQCLSNTRKLTEYFLNNYKTDTNKTMSNEYYRVLKHLWDVNSTNKSYSPNSFKEVLSKENPLFAGIQANDSKDLINFLIERLHLELNFINQNKNNNDSIDQLDQTNELSMLKIFIEEFNQKFNSPVSNLFYGILETKSRCQGCNIIKFNFQVYSFLEFPLQQVNQYYFNTGRRPLFTPDGKNPDVDLYECFEYYRKIDLMNGENQMFCNICNKLCDTLYSTTLYSGPNYLIINLNRGKGAVYECKVNFPSQLNILNYVTYRQGITTYELYAVICHLGPSSMSGHFVAYCRNRIDNKWYLYNDAFVTECTKKYQYNDGMPYILFYRALISD